MLWDFIKFAEYLTFNRHLFDLPLFLLKVAVFCGCCEGRHLKSWCQVPQKRRIMQSSFLFSAFFISRLQFWLLYNLVSSLWTERKSKVLKAYMFVIQISSKFSQMFEGCTPEPGYMRKANRQLLRKGRLTVCLSDEQTQIVIENKFMFRGCVVSEALFGVGAKNHF